MPPKTGLNRSRGEIGILRSNRGFSRRRAPDIARIEPTLEEYRHSLPRPVARVRGWLQCRDIAPGEESSNGWDPAAVPGPRAGLCPSPRRAGRGEEIQPGPAGAGANFQAPCPVCAHRARNTLIPATVTNGLLNPLNNSRPLSYGGGT